MNPLNNTYSVYVLFYAVFPDFRKALLFGRSPGFALHLLVRAIWNIRRKILIGEKLLLKYEERVGLLFIQ
jgi:hypothetical protein